MQGSNLLAHDSAVDKVKVPGDSPAHYLGDPSNDILDIESLNLVPNPPRE